MKLTQKNFDMFCEALNHRMTRVEESVKLLRNDVKWIKHLGYYLAAIISIAIGKLIFIGG